MTHDVPDLEALGFIVGRCVGRVEPHGLPASVPGAEGHEPVEVIRASCVGSIQVQGDPPSGLFRA